MDYEEALLPVICYTSHGHANLPPSRDGLAHRREREDRTREVFCAFLVPKGPYEPRQHVQGKVHITHGYGTRRGLGVQDASESFDGQESKGRQAQESMPCRETALPPTISPGYRIHQPQEAQAK